LFGTDALSSPPANTGRVITIPPVVVSRMLVGVPLATLTMPEIVTLDEAATVFVDCDETELDWLCTVDMGARVS